MKQLTKSTTIRLIVTLFLSSLLLIEPTLALTVTKPVVPEFKLSYTNNVYDVPPSTTPDEWTGEPKTIPGYHVDYRSVAIKIKNQPHTGYLNGNPNDAPEQLFYNIRVKSHSSNSWTELSASGEGMGYYGSTDETLGSEVTIIGINFNGPSNILHAYSTDISLGNQVDFQVKALIGYQNGNVFFGEESAWSQTQTLTFDMSGNQTTSSPTATNTPLPTNQPTITPTSPQSTANLTSMPLNIFIIVVISFLIVTISLLLLYRRAKQAQPINHSTTQSSV